MKQTTSSRSLPEDLIIEILSRLPVKTLLRFKSASKSLFNLIISPEFVKLHLRRFPVVRNSSKILLYSDNPFLALFDVDYPQCPLVQLDTHPDVIKLLEPYLGKKNEYRIPWIIGISNGVVCFKKHKEIVLYNPATRAYRQVPRRKFHAKCRDELIAYDCVGDDFKIFSIIKYYGKRRDSDECDTYFYNLKDNSWSKIKSPPRGFHSFDQPGCRIANDSLYWLTYDRGLVNLRVVRFDVSSHKYEEISLPIPVTGLWKIRLGVLNGRLHLMDQEFDLNIWMLVEDKCWIRVFHSSDSEYRHFLSSHSMTHFSLEPYAYSKDGRRIIIGDLHMFKKVICCDLESQTISMVQVLGLPEVGTFTVIPLQWTESLVPLG